MIYIALDPGLTGAIAAIDYDRRATEHRPADRRLMAAEIRRLVDTGLTTRDVASALRLDPTSAADALRPPSPAITHHRGIST